MIHIPSLHNNNWKSDNVPSFVFQTARAHVFLLYVQVPILE